MYERTYKAKVLSQKAEQEKKRRKRFPWRRTLNITAIVLALVAIVLFIRAPKLQVASIDVVGAQVTDPEDVQRFIRSNIEGNILLIFPKASMLLVPTASLAKWTAREFPRLASIDIRRKGLNGLLVSVVEREGAYLWCPPKYSERCFFMTEGGVVFAPAPFFSGDAYIKVMIGEEQTLPFTPLTDTMLSLIRFLSERLPSLSILPNEIRLVSEHELDVIFSHQGDRAILMIDPAGNVEQALEDLSTGLAAEPLRTEFRSAHKTLEYLDARFANKLIYKFK